MNAPRDFLADSAAHRYQVQLLAELRALRHLVRGLGLCPNKLTAQLSMQGNTHWKWDCLSALQVARDFTDPKFKTVSVDDANAWLDQLNIKESS